MQEEERERLLKECYKFLHYLIQSKEDEQNKVDSCEAHIKKVQERITELETQVTIEPRPSGGFRHAGNARI